MGYRYCQAPPRSNPTHYMYAPFEGTGLLRSYLDLRRSWCDSLVECEGEETAAGIPLDGSSHTTADTLRTCAMLWRQGKSAPGLVGEFYRKRIEVGRFLHAAYRLPGGESASELETDSTSYAYAAFIFANSMNASSCSREWLQWYNALLKTVDILIASQTRELPALALQCAKSAVLCEISALLVTADLLGVPL
jgi:hypothetical protein